VAHATLILRPGVDLNLTPTLNSAGLSESNLIRFIPDPVLGAIPQKLGGWTKYYPSQIGSTIRALWAWEDTDAVTHLSFGSVGASGTAQVGVITNGSIQNVTPQNTVNSTETLAASSTAGQSRIIITDSTVTGITQYDSVYIPVHIAIGGVVLFGQYQTGIVSNTSYAVTAVDTLGNPLPATATSAVPTTAQISVTNGGTTATIVLPKHGYSVGSTYPLLVSTTVGGVTLYGQYYVQSIVDADTFTINTSVAATSTASVFVNSKKGYYVYNFGVGSVGSGTGFGIGGFGSGGFGTGSTVSPASGSPIAATDWSLDNWGETLIVSPTSSETVPFQPVYQWSPTTGSPKATIIPQAPVISEQVLVAMPQRQLISLGSTFNGVQDPLLIRWCDVGNYNSWIGTPTNQAGSYRLSKGSKIIGGLTAPNQILVWTDVDVWAMTYQGLPYVYGFNEIGTGCGLIGKRAAGILGGITFWMSQSQFFTLSSQGVSPLACPVWDVIFQDLDTANLWKIRCAVNSRFNEVMWFYPTNGSGGEISAYVKFNPAIGTWDYGNLSRTAWIDQSVLGPPIGADGTTNYIYQHETGYDADDQAMQPSLQTGWFSISDGDYQTTVDQVWPDFKYGYFNNANQNATLQMTFYVADYPTQTPKVFGPYTITKDTQYISPRFRGRLVSIGISSNDIGTFWRLGGVRYRFIGDGRF
jgi:hypothetical protein